MTPRPTGNSGDVSAPAQRSFGVRPTLSDGGGKSANDNEAHWPLVPFPDLLDSNPPEHQQISTENIRPPFLGEPTRHEVRPDIRPSWRATLGMVTYLVAGSVAMFGWVYLLWLTFKWLLSSPPTNLTCSNWRTSSRSPAFEGA